MPTQLLLTRILNRNFAAPVDHLLGAFGVHPAYPRAPITNAFAMELIVFFTLLVFFVIVRMRLSVENPNPVQHLAEGIHGFVSTQSESIIGHGYERFTSFLTALGLFILLSNLIGLVPGLESPTANVVVPLGCAICVFLYYHFQGLRVNGLGYFKQFAGPVWWMAPLLIPVELISHLARILSLTVRLYANIFAGDLVILAFFSLIPFGIPLIFIGLHLGVDIVQAYVFILLAMSYLSLAVAEEH